MTVVVIIAILAVLMFPAFSGLINRTDGTRCMANLRNLYYGASGYVQQNGHWPQIDTTLIKASGGQYAAAWRSALEPFGVTQEIWICPTVQRELQNPDITKPEFARSDYMATPFDAKPTTPYQWQTQPWFVERGDVHGNGNLMIFTDGHIAALNDVRKPAQP
jgi:type II secretory pathway pseudopilin PulG